VAGRGGVAAGSAAPLRRHGRQGANIVVADFDVPRMERTVEEV